MSKYSIEIEGLSHSFGQHNVLEDVTLKIDSSTFVSVVGPNGAGKSTLLKILLGLENPSSGKVRILDKDPGHCDNEKIAYVPQIKTLERTFPAVPAELIFTGIRSKWSWRMSQKDRQVAEESLELVGAGHLKGKQLRNLSGGELQRVYLARAFARNSKILLLDEPATGIDHKGELDMHKIIDDYKQKTGATIIMITHDWESAYHHSDKVLLMNKKVICFNEPEEAFKDEHMRRAFGHIGHDHDIVFGAKH